MTNYFICMPNIDKLYLFNPRLADKYTSYNVCAQCIRHLFISTGMGLDKLKKASPGYLFQISHLVP